ncbi:PadR family transcriptional regulator [bacterium]|nr:PadR family transcriptional regulator [bacterium]
MTTKILSRAEELVLLAVWKLGDGAYGVTIRKLIIERTQQEWSIGAIYVPLDRLTQWGFLDAIDGAPTAERGGRRKRYFRLTAQGIAALERLKKVQDDMWSDLPDLALNRGDS